jgi:hypothetical protein
MLPLRWTDCNFTSFNTEWRKSPSVKCLVSESVRQWTLSVIIIKCLLTRCLQKFGLRFVGYWSRDGIVGAPRRCLVTDWMAGKTQFDSRQEQCCLHFRLSGSIPDLNRPPIQCVPGPFLWCKATGTGTWPLISIYFPTLTPLPFMPMHCSVQYNTAVPYVLWSRTVPFPLKSFIQLCNNLFCQLNLTLLCTTEHYFNWSAYISCVRKSSFMTPCACLGARSPCLSTAVRLRDTDVFYERSYFYILLLFKFLIIYENYIMFCSLWYCY